MKKFRVDIWKPGEYSYPLAFSFRPNIMAMLHEDNMEHPCILVVPGGSYCFLSPTEGENVADRFFQQGFNCFVLSYTTDLTLSVPLRLQPLKDISRAIRLIRAHAEEYQVIPNNLAICGFSAGGHLCASICAHFMNVMDCDPALRHYSNRPDAAILSYPVICSREYTHRESMQALWGSSPSDEELDFSANEKNVTELAPPCFLWHTLADDIVPVENSLRFAQACMEHSVPFALHLFSEGPHGLATADDYWLHESWKADYVLEQTYVVLEQVKNGTIQKVHEHSMLEAFLHHGKQAFPNSFLYGATPVPEVAAWPQIAYAWLVKQFNLYADIPLHR